MCCGLLLCLVSDFCSCSPPQQLIRAIVILLVFWYCHKRGREVRLEKERRLTEVEVSQLEKEYAAMNPEEYPTTTAPEGSSIEEVEAGMKEVQEARRIAAEQNAAGGENLPSTLNTTVQPAETVGT